MHETELYAWIVNEGFTIKPDGIPMLETMPEWQAEIAKAHGVTSNDSQPLWEASCTQAQTPLTFSKPGFTPKKKKRIEKPNGDTPFAPGLGLVGGALSRKKGDIKPHMHTHNVYHHFLTNTCDQQ